MNRYLLFSMLILLVSCGGGGSSAEPPATVPPVSQAPPPAEEPEPEIVDPVETASAAARLLTQATFGPTDERIEALTGTSASEWFLAELDKTPSYYLPLIDEGTIGGASTYFWENAISGEDQLRQRMVFALSEIIVVSDFGGEILTDVPIAGGYYQDLLVEHAFGNYRDLLEDITYSPAMAIYLTYLGNRKGDPDTGRVPDENYARELLQLFTVGVAALNPDGTLQTDSTGSSIELYDNSDITGLARVFTGLFFEPSRFESGSGREFDIGTLDDAAWTEPLGVYPEIHSELEKSFLGTTIPAGTGPRESVTLALDHIFAHPNVPPFVSRQLIQRFVTSHPEPAYVERVAAAFEAGSYQLPNGNVVGDGRRGDLSATIAAILMDDEARSPSAREAESFGKLREPAIRFTNWARAFNVEVPAPQYVFELRNAGEAAGLAQQPFSARSVFNFFRPGYVAPGTLTGAAGLTMPELQIVNASSIPGFINFMTFFVVEEKDSPEYLEEVREAYAGFIEEQGLDDDIFDEELAARAMLPDYSAEFALVDNPTALLDRVDRLLTLGEMTDETRDSILEAMEAIPDDQAPIRVYLAILMTLSSPDYLVQR